MYFYACKFIIYTSINKILITLQDLQTISQLSSNGQSQTTEQTLIGETIGKGPPTYYQVVTSPNITDDNSTSTEEEVPAYNTLSEEQLPQYQEVASC